MTRLPAADVAQYLRTTTAIPFEEYARVVMDLIGLDELRLRAVLAVLDRDPSATPHAERLRRLEATSIYRHVSEGAA